MKKRKIIRNAIQCKLCGEIIESTSTHDFVKCKCGACAVDGGHEYMKYCCMYEDCFIDLSEIIDEEQD